MTSAISKIFKPEVLLAKIVDSGQNSLNCVKTTLFIGALSLTASIAKSALSAHVLRSELKFNLANIVGISASGNFSNSANNLRFDFINLFARSSALLCLSTKSTLYPF